MKIAIFGRAGSGKDTIASLIQEKHKNINTRSFATPLKNTLLTMYHQAGQNCLFGNSDLRNNIIPGTNLTYRSFLKDLSVFMKQYDVDIFTKNLEFRAKDTDHIITDGRFVCDFNFCKNNNYLTLKIKRNSKSDNSSFEDELDTIPEDQFDIVFDNNGSMDDLINFVQQFNFVKG